MRAAELHLLKPRRYQGPVQKARRGALHFALPGGYVHHAPGEVVDDPDEHVHHGVRLIVRTLAALGTRPALLRSLVPHGLQLGVRVWEGPGKGTLEWRRPHRMTLQTLVKPPISAGASASGRRPVDPRQQQPGRPSTGRATRARPAYHGLLKAPVPASITWAQDAQHRAR